ncbi:MAG: M3 family metallopeptidase [Myxococcota bacterium]
MRAATTVVILALWTTACATPAPTTTPTPDQAGTPAGEAGLKLDLEHDTDRDDPVWSSAERLTARCDAGLDRARALREQLKQPVDGPRTEANTLEPFDRMLETLDTSSGWAGLLFSVHPDAEVRDAARECQERLARFSNDVNLDRGLYEAVAAVDSGGLDGLSQRFVEHLLRDFRRSGVDQDEETRARLAAIHERMVEIGQDFQKNVREDVRSIEVDGPEALAGLPQDYIDAHPPGDDGKIRITTDYPDFFPFETYAEDGELRRALYQEFMQRGWPGNAELLKELLALRDEYASTLGFDTWAAYNAEDKMVRTADTIEQFIEQVAESARPRMEADLEDLLARKREDEPSAEHIQVWDRFYYVGKVREARFDFDARDVRPYFPYPRVRDGILDLYAELFGVRFEVDASQPVWHESVEAVAMYDGDELIGRFYLDMHPRPGKYKHAAMFPIQTGLAEGRIPAASLICNFPEPGEGSDALMEHSDVVTFFHEFGHLIHHLLARRGQWVSLAGINVEWDFVEAPSQILEEWAWEPTVLQRFAKHVETGEPIPADMVHRMEGAEEFGKGVHVMRQVFYTAYSYYMHARDPETLDLEAFTDEIYERYNPYPRLEDSRVYANFGHLIGYSSMYYTYQWSLVIAKDLFTRFREAGLLNDEVAREYRRAILEPGGTKDAAEMVEDFLGRPFSLEAYREWLERPPGG